MPGIERAVGTRVIVHEIPHYLKRRIGHGYCKLAKGLIGTVVGHTAAKDKVAVDFDQPIWTLKEDGERSSFDNGCHGKGRKAHSCYILHGCISTLHKDGQPHVIEYNKATIEQLPERQRRLSVKQEELLLLL